jgi:hypothetical protein
VVEVSDAVVVGSGSVVVVSGAVVVVVGGSVVVVATALPVTLVTDQWDRSGTLPPWFEGVWTNPDAGPVTVMMLWFGPPFAHSVAVNPALTVYSIPFFTGVTLPHA